MSEKIYKKVEVVGTSTKSFSAAVENAVEKAGQSVHNLDWFEVVEERGLIENGKISQYQVTVKIGFRLD